MPVWWPNDVFEWTALKNLSHRYDGNLGNEQHMSEFPEPRKKVPQFVKIGILNIHVFKHSVLYFIVLHWSSIYGQPVFKIIFKQITIS